MPLLRLKISGLVTVMKLYTDSAYLRCSCLDTVSITLATAVSAGGKTSVVCSTGVCFVDLALTVVVG